VIVRGTGFSLVSRHPRAISRPQRITRRIQELRRGRSKTFRMRVRIPRVAHGRSCVAAVASADAARPARARLCARVARR
jgi:hypothetical protein